jgi:hypothetical protein
MSTSKSRDGIVLIEFLFVALLLLMIVFMGAQFGLMISQLQFTAEGARIAVKEASTKPGALVIPAANGVYVDPGVFDERFTVIDVASFRNPTTGAPLAAGATLDDQFNLLPPGNRALRSHMFLDSVTVPGRTLLRFQGVLLQLPGSPAFKYLVRVPDVAGSTARLRRVISPPAANPADGLLQFECWQWFSYTTWLLPGGAVLPASLTYTNLPPGGYTVLKLDVEPASRAGTRLVSYGVARKEIQ